MTQEYVATVEQSIAELEAFNNALRVRLAGLSGRAPAAPTLPVRNVLHSKVVPVTANAHTAGQCHDGQGGEIVTDGGIAEEAEAEVHEEPNIAVGVPRASSLATIDRDDFADGAGEEPLAHLYSRPHALPSPSLSQSQPPPSSSCMKKDQEQQQQQHQCPLLQPDQELKSESDVT